MGPRVAKQFAPGHAVVTDPGAEPDVGWMPTLLFISFCLFLVVYSLIPKLLLRIRPDNNLGTENPAAINWSLLGKPPVHMTGERIK